MHSTFSRLKSKALTNSRLQSEATLKTCCTYFRIKGISQDLPSWSKLQRAQVTLLKTKFMKADEAFLFENISPQSDVAI
jgi:hypothetical protein